ncbi:MAG: hypothetical protein ACK58L_11025 [Planctomycetota bacterium]
MVRSLLTSVVILLCLVNVLNADEAVPLDEHLKPFAPLLGKTWRGEFANSTPEKPMVDVSRWERALNGKAIRVVHSVNEGMYGGETTILWDSQKKSLVYWYFTTAGFRTEGTMKFEDGVWSGREVVIGGAGGISEVRSTTRLLPNGRMQVKAEYVTDGKSGESREVEYVETPDAKVIFR